MTDAKMLNNIYIKRHIWYTIEVIFKMLKNSWMHSVTHPFRTPELSVLGLELWNDGWPIGK